MNFLMKLIRFNKNFESVKNSKTKVKVQKKNQYFDQIVKGDIKFTKGVSMLQNKEKKKNEQKPKKKSKVCNT